jgi:NAD(P)H-dependent flavin oxidoreductase YrpB (nitropropane dioxygenase family)
MGSVAMRTRFTELIGCTAPIQLAAMPGVGTPDLAAAVANAGGLGMIGVPLLPPDVVTALLADLSRLTARPFGVNFLMPFLDPDCVSIAARAARVVEFFYGEPERALVDEVHIGGALASWQVGSLDEARTAAAAGCDFIIAQGSEAGGHVRGCVGLLPLLSQVVDAVSVPVLAAGGIATARDVAAALAAGAAGVRVGTRFVASAESGAHPLYVDALLRARSEDTVLTETFSVMWPNAPHRVLRACVDAAQGLTQAIAGEVDWGGQTMPIPRFAVVAPTAGTRGAVEAMALYAGQSVGAVNRVQPAAEIVRELDSGAQRLLGAWGA